MNQLIRFAVLSFALALTLEGCSGKSPESTDQAVPAAQEPVAEPLAAAPAAPPAEAVVDEPAKPQQATPAAAPPVPQPKAEAPAATHPAAKPATAAQTAPVETPMSTAPVTAAPPEPAIVPSEPAAAEPKPRVAKDVVVLTGSPLGGVRFEHKLHGARAGNDCTRCHHASRPEKAASAPQQACSECHSKVATPPMKTIYQGAFHNPMAQSGTCIDCHKAENAKGKKAPLTCMECHKQENK